MGYLIDHFGRNHTYLRISVTDRCNLRCSYCLPSHDPVDTEVASYKGGRRFNFRPRNELLSYDEITELTRIFVALGIRKVRITGGEPLVRKNIDRLCSQISTIPGLSTLAISTNGTYLAPIASLLHKSGVRTINISLDSLRENRFKQITHRDAHAEVLRGIEAAIRTGFESVKVNAVIMREINDDELLDFVEYADALSINVRFIEYMPFPGNRWNDLSYVSYGEMKTVIESKYRLIPIQSSESVCGPAKDFYVERTNAVIGFITTMSEHFCGSCNRLRLTADGRLRTCLFSQDGLDLKYLLRSGASQEGIEECIRAAVLTKWEKHPEPEVLTEFQDRTMTAIGG
jgi:GTP 3',8-cyclase